MTKPTTEPAKPRRRHLVLSLRALMLLILVVGGLMGWKARRASLQRRAVARIERLRGSVEYDWQANGRNYFAPAVTTGPNAPSWLRKMLGDEYFQEVILVTLPDIMMKGLPLPPPPLDAPIDGPEWQAIRDQLRADKEAKEDLAKDQLACLEGLDRLETLELQGLALNSNGEARLGRLVSLKKFTSFEPLDDEGLAQLARLNNLEILELTFNAKPLTDVGLNHLKGLTKLKFIGITGDSVRRQALDELKTAIPGLTIFTDRTQEAPSGGSGAMSSPPEIKEAHSYMSSKSNIIDY